MRQYNQIKAKHPDTILLFRLGDFFETFGEDAVTTAKVCGITLTKRNNGAGGDMPLAGFPHHQLDGYLPKIVRAGFRVAVCEQLEDPKMARGIVKRDVVEVVTPGVALYDKLLDSRKNTYVASLVVHAEKNGSRAAVAFADASTAEFQCCELAMTEIVSFLESIAPAELVLMKSQVQELGPLLDRLPLKPSLTRLEDWIFEEHFGRETLIRQLRTQNLKGFGVDHLSIATRAAGALMHYISETQQGRVAHFSSLRVYDAGEYMALDAATRRNLEITSSMQDQDASLVSVLDDTLTPMGGRLLRAWLMRPLRSMERIQSRLSVVSECVEHPELLAEIRQLLKPISDLERLTSKICTQRATPRDLQALRASLEVLPSLKKCSRPDSSRALLALLSSLDCLEDTVARIASALVDEPSLVFGSGAIFRQGFDAQLDEYREAMYSGKNWIHNYQEQLRDQTAIPSLKVSFNNVFGYYIEISNTHKNRVPSAFDRKQTLANAERYTTPELKDIESKILQAEEKIGGLEQKLFAELRSAVAEVAHHIQSNAQLIATLDCLQSFATVSIAYNYCKAELGEDGVLDVKDGRHPVVERLLPVGQSYVANSTSLDIEREQIHIITGPNMAGKSCYLRQVGLIVLLSHIGCYVPARAAKVPLCDRIFTRVGAQDNIASGESTFLVEMQEAANILNNATQQSLILLDEVGRGTATFDGISIAWSIVEFLHDRCGAKTLFATHYHELNDLAELLPRIKNYNVEVQEVGNSVIFSRRVLPGSTDHSFGIHVAQMAGLPREVTSRAREILATLENNNQNLVDSSSGHSLRKVRSASTTAVGRSEHEHQISMFELRDDAIRAELSEVDVNSLTPIQALQQLSTLVEKAKKNE